LNERDKRKAWSNRPNDDSSILLLKASKSYLILLHSFLQNSLWMKLVVEDDEMVIG